MHPKTNIRPTAETIARLLKSGWVGQPKIHGHRAQIHLHADQMVYPTVFNRHGRPHRKELPPEMVKELRRIFTLKSGWTVIDAEWLKPEERLYIFDLLKKDGQFLRPLTYGERWSMLPKDYISRYVRTLPVFKTLERCMKVMSSTEPHIEGLVFKAWSTKGFEDVSIVRCRKVPCA